MNKTEIIWSTSIVILLVFAIIVIVQTAGGTVVEQGNYYELFDDSIHVEIYKDSQGYNVVSYPNGTIAVYETRWQLQYWRTQGGGKWRDIGTPYETGVFDGKLGQGVYRSFTDYDGTDYNITFELQDGLKVSVNFKSTAEPRQYRLVWNLDGIVNMDYVEFAESVEYYDILINYADAEELWPDGTYYEHTTTGNGRKAEFFFDIGYASNFTLDPKVKLVKGVPQKELLESDELTSDKPYDIVGKEHTVNKLDSAHIAFGDSIVNYTSGNLMEIRKTNEGIKFGFLNEGCFSITNIIAQEGRWLVTEYHPTIRDDNTTNLKGKLTGFYINSALDENGYERAIIDYQGINDTATVCHPANYDPVIGTEYLPEEISTDVYRFRPENTYYQTGSTTTIIGISESYGVATIKPNQENLVGLWTGYRAREIMNVQGYLDPITACSACTWSDAQLTYNYGGPNPGWRMDAEGDLSPSIIKKREEWMIFNYVNVSASSNLWAGNAITTELNTGSNNFYAKYVNQTGGNEFLVGDSGSAPTQTNLFISQGKNGTAWYQRSNSMIKNSTKDSYVNISSTSDMHIGLGADQWIYYTAYYNASYKPSLSATLASRVADSAYLWPWPDTYASTVWYTEPARWDEAQLKFNISINETQPAGTNITIGYRFANYSNITAWPYIEVMYDFSGGTLNPIKSDCNALDIYTGWEGSYEESEYVKLGDGYVETNLTNFYANARLLSDYNADNCDIADLGGSATRGGGYCVTFEAYSDGGNLIYSDTGMRLATAAGGSRFQCFFDDFDGGTDRSFYFGVSSVLDTVRTVCCIYDPDLDLGIGVIDGINPMDGNISFATGYSMGYFDYILYNQAYGNSEGNFKNGKIYSIIYVNETPADLTELNFTKYYNGDEPYWSDWSDWSEGNVTLQTETFEAIQLRYNLSNPSGTTGMPIFHYADVLAVINGVPTTPTTIFCDSTTDCNKSVSSVAINATGSTDLEDDVLTYICDAGINESTLVLEDTTHRVSASMNDREETESTGSLVSATSSDLEIVKDSADQYIGVMFDGVAIPQGSTIFNATIEFEVDSTSKDSADAYANITGHDVDDSWDFDGGSGDISLRDMTAAIVEWTLPASGSANDKKLTDNISSIIEEIVGRGGWESGNNLTIIFSPGSGTREYESWDGENSNAPFLRVTYGVDAVARVWYEIGNHTRGNSFALSTEGNYTGLRCRAKDLDGSNVSGDYYTTLNVSLNITAAEGSGNNNVSVDTFYNISVSATGAVFKCNANATANYTVWTLDACGGDILGNVVNNSNGQNGTLSNWTLTHNTAYAFICQASYNGRAQDNSSCINVTTLVAPTAPDLTNVLASADGVGDANSNWTGTWTESDANGDAIYNITWFNMSGKTPNTIIDFNNATGTDHSGNDNDLTIPVDAELVYVSTGSFDGSGYYDWSGIGPYDYAMTFSDINVLNTTLPFTLTAWINPDGGFAADGYGFLFSRAGQYEIYVDEISGTGRLAVFEYLSSSQADTTDAVITPDVWQHIAVVYDGAGTYALYVNGTDHTDDSSLDESDWDEPVNVGPDANGDYGFNGSMDDIRIYPYALSADQVARIANQDATLDMDETSLNDVWDFQVCLSDASFYNCSSDDFTVESASSCEYGGSGDWIVTDQCQVVGVDYTVCPNIVNITATGYLNVSGGSKINASKIRWVPKDAEELFRMRWTSSDSVTWSVC